MTFKRLRMFIAASAISVSLIVPSVMPCTVYAQDTQSAQEETLPGQEDAADKEEGPSPEGETSPADAPEENKEEGTTKSTETETKKSKKKKKTGTGTSSGTADAETEYLSQAATAVDECKSGIVEVAVGYEFDDGSFDPWLTGTGFLVSQDRALTLTKFTSVSQDSEAYDAIVNSRKSGYLALGIDITNFANIEPNLALCVYAADGSRIRAEKQDIDDTVSLVTLSKQLVGIRPFTLATAGTFEKGFQSGYTAGFKKKLLENTLPATIKNVFIEEASVKAIQDGRIEFLSTSDDGIAGGPIIGSDMTAYGICLGSSAGTGSAADISTYYDILAKEEYGITFDVVERQRSSLFDPPYVYIFMGILAAVIIVCAAVGILLIKSSGKSVPAKEKKVRREKEKKPFFKKKKKDTGEVPEEEDGSRFRDTAPDETEAYDEEYQEREREREKEDRLRRIREAKENEEERKRRSRQILDDDDEDGEGDTGVLTKKSFPYLIRTSTGERIDISKSPYVLGKSQNDADYRIKGNNTISKRHCEICTKTDGSGRQYIHDLGSKNDTSVNGVIVKGDVVKYLKDGDTVKLSDEEFTYHGV